MKSNMFVSLLRHGWSSYALGLLLAAGLLFLPAPSAKAANYTGNGDAGFGGPVGNGTLSVTDDGTAITFTLTRGGGDLNDVLVIYIDSKSGGFTDTAGFTDGGDSARKAISGFDGGGNRSVLTFTNGFQPDYAITFEGGYASLFTLANGGSFPYGSGTGQSGNSSATFSLTINASQIGLTPGVNSTFKLFGTYISGGGYRSTEAIAGNDTTSFSQGWNPFTQTDYASYNFDAGAPVPHPVTFQVDMAAQVANFSFNPDAGGTVYVTGSFEDVPGTGFQLSPSDPPNTSIYTGTYSDLNSADTVESFKYYYVSAGLTNSEGLNRPFTVSATAQTLPLVYFNDVPPESGIPTHALTFQIDLTPQIDLGNFVPETGTIEVRGTFQTPVQWTSGFQLTNNPTLSGSASNLYTGTYPDGNYPDTFEQYKFVIVGNSANYESINNRIFATPSGDQTFPVAYFNNVTNAYTIPVTFQVDMTVPLLLGTFNPAAGDTCGVAGKFQTDEWTVGPDGFLLSPSVDNPSLYSGTYIVMDAPGTGEEYKFVINTNGGNTAYETIANRTFILAAADQTLPVVYWDNVTNAYTIPVTFQVDMTVPLLLGTFNPAAGDTCGVAGQFQANEWTVGPDGFLLSPSVDNPNLYSGTYIVTDAPGTGEEYKFVINTNGGSTAYETIANRTFGLAATTQTLPVVYWDDVNASGLLLADTPVTFTVDMNGAVGTDAHVFNPATDKVYINGQFANWYGWAGGPNPADAQQYELTDLSGSGIYSNTIVIPKGTVVAFYYKYGMGIAGSPYASDNEAQNNSDHYRVVRATALNPYPMPQDTFGNQYHEPFLSKDNLAGADLIISPAAAGETAVSWLGRPGAHLQSTSSLTADSWQDHWETDGTNWTAGVSSTNGLISVTNWPAGGIRFFRIAKP